MGWIGGFGAGTWKRPLPSGPDGERWSDHGLRRGRGQHHGRHGELAATRRDQDGLEMVVLVRALVRDQCERLGPLRGGRTRRMVMRLVPVVVPALSMVVRQVLVDQRMRHRPARQGQRSHQQDPGCATPRRGQHGHAAYPRCLPRDTPPGGPARGVDRKDPIRIFESSSSRAPSTGPTPSRHDVPGARGLRERVLRVAQAFGFTTGAEDAVLLRAARCAGRGRGASQSLRSVGRPESRERSWGCRSPAGPSRPGKLA